MTITVSCLHHASSSPGWGRAHPCSLPWVSPCHLCLHQLWEVSHRPHVKAVCPVHWLNDHHQPPPMGSRHLILCPPTSSNPPKAPHCFQDNIRVLDTRRICGELAGREMAPPRSTQGVRRPRMESVGWGEQVRVPGHLKTPSPSWLY